MRQRCWHHYRPVPKDFKNLPIECAISVLQEELESFQEETEVSNAVREGQ